MRKCSKKENQIKILLKQEKSKKKIRNQKFRKCFALSNSFFFFIFDFFVMFWDEHFLCPEQNSLYTEKSFFCLQKSFFVSPKKFSVSQNWHHFRGTLYHPKSILYPPKVAPASVFPLSSGNQEIGRSCGRWIETTATGTCEAQDGEQMRKMSHFLKWRDHDPRLSGVLWSP